MRVVIACFLLCGILSCSTDVKPTQQIKVLNKESEVEPTEVETIEVQKIKEELVFKEITLFENKLDTFSVPFPNKNMLSALSEYYRPYWVEKNIGQQDGPDFTFIDIVRDDENPVAYLSFNADDEYLLDDIRIVDSSAVDQYGVRVGDTYQEIKIKRDVVFSNSTSYHQHTYLFTDSSNIYYELKGDFLISEDLIDNVENLQFTEEQLQNSTVESIIWRNENY